MKRKTFFLRVLGTDCPGAFRAVTRMLESQVSAGQIHRIPAVHETAASSPRVLCPGTEDGEHAFHKRKAKQPIPNGGRQLRNNQQECLRAGISKPCCTAGGQLASACPPSLAEALFTAAPCGSHYLLSSASCQLSSSVILQPVSFLSP